MIAYAYCFRDSLRVLCDLTPSILLSILSTTILALQRLAFVIGFRHDASSQDHYDGHKHIRHRPKRVSNRPPSQHCASHPYWQCSSAAPPASTARALLFCRVLRTMDADEFASGTYAQSIHSKVNKPYIYPNSP